MNDILQKLHILMQALPLRENSFQVQVDINHGRLKFLCQQFWTGPLLQEEVCEASPFSLAYALISMLGVYWGLQGL
jgi:hypothetical protein